MISNLTQRHGLKRQGLRRLRWLSPSLVALVVAVLFSAATPAAKADAFNYDFTLTGGGNTITFTIPSTFTEASYSAGNYFQTAPISYTMNGTTEAAVPVSFWNASQGGGMILGDYNGSSQWILNQGGAQFYTGSESAPTGFTLGTYNLTDWGGAALGGDFTLTIVDPPIGNNLPTPEPSSLLLLGVGLLSMSGLVAYQQKRRGALTGVPTV